MPTSSGAGDAGSQAPWVRWSRGGCERPRAAAARPDAFPLPERLETRMSGLARGSSLYPDARRLWEHRRGGGAGPRFNGTGEATGSQGAGPPGHPDVSPHAREDQGARTAVLTAEAPPGGVALASTISRVCESGPPELASPSSGRSGGERSISNSTLVDWLGGKRSMVSW